MLEGQLFMIADGANSPTRQKLNVELTTWPYNQQALVATVAMKNHINKPPTKCLILMVLWPFYLYPTPSMLYSLVY